MVRPVRVLKRKVRKVGFGRTGTLATQRCSTVLRCSTFEAGVKGGALGGCVGGLVCWRRFFCREATWRG